MEERPRSTTLERENMTVIKYSYVGEASHNICNNKLNHIDQSETRRDDSTEEALVRNNFCHIDNPESSHDSPVEDVCLVDNNSNTEKHMAVVESCNAPEDKENINESRTGQWGDGYGPGM